ncbi:CPBP family intramembrane metalloprotease [candidate division WWE3 bacterium]|jgi:hypothetical protein|uniref:CPBP family intramembrane metalloprotease n=1 Tax=candidate division WWE3 bacterium TaxID=2053526 RepID=A0A3A4ZC40_UNCKA|nr:MAG: CPBP family intramembrane metalloprotease [candidate division WWE3 bacterium]
MSAKDKAKREMKHQSLVLATAIVVYFFVGNFWNPTGFDPLGYWNLSKMGFWETMRILWPIAVIVPFLLGQLDWLNSSLADKLENGKFIRTPLPFKILRASFAGITEELGHRGFYIYFIMLIITLLNEHLDISITLAFAFAFSQVVPKAKTAMARILYGVTILAAYLLLRNMIYPDLVYDILGSYVKTYEWILSPENRLTIGTAFMCIWAGDSLLRVTGINNTLKFLPRNRAEAKKKAFMKELFTPSMVLQQLVFTAGLLGLNFWMITQTNPEAVLGGQPLLVMGITLSFFRFGMVHSYQGWLGVLGAFFFGIYMQHVAFTYGLQYAIVVHVLYNSVLFASEHITQGIKDWIKPRMIPQEAD